MYKYNIKGISFILPKEFYYENAKNQKLWVLNVKLLTYRERQKNINIQKVIEIENNE